MRAHHLRPIVETLVPEPVTDLPEKLVQLSLCGRGPDFGWIELRGWVSVERGLSGHEADQLILDALREGDLVARLNFEQDAWRVRVSATATRPLLLRYALDRFEAAAVDLDEPWEYRRRDGRLVRALIPELDAFAQGDDPAPCPPLYRQLLEEGADA